MSIPWQPYADEHARTVDTMTAAAVFAAFLLDSEIHVPGTHRPDAVNPVIALAAHSCGALFRKRTHPPHRGASRARSVGGALRAGRHLGAAPRPPPAPLHPPLPAAQNPVTHRTGTMRRQERTP